MGRDTSTVEAMTELAELCATPVQGAMDCASFKLDRIEFLDNF